MPSRRKAIPPDWGVSVIPDGDCWEAYGTKYLLDSSLEDRDEPGIHAEGRDASAALDALCVKLWKREKKWERGEG